MITKLLRQQLEENKYILLPSSVPQYSVYFRPEGNVYIYLHVVECTDSLIINHEEYVLGKKELAKQVSKQLNVDGHVMSLILYEDYDKALELAGDDYFTWLIDKNTLTITNDDSRVEDFYGLKSELTGYLDNCKRILSTNDLKEINKAFELEDTKRYKPPKRKPAPAIITIVMLNILFFSAYIIIGEPFNRSGEMGVQYIQNGEYYRILTAMFLHGGVNHLVSNMLILYFLGEMMEHIIGTPKVATIYMLSGLFGNVVSYAYDYLSGINYTSLGASGAVYGLMGAIIVLAVRRSDIIKIPPARIVLLLVFSIYSSFAEPNIDIAAHMGGLIAGFLLGILLIKSKEGSRSEG